MTSTRRQLVTVCYCLFFSLAAHNTRADSKVVLSDIYTIDDLYKSMMGPASTQEILLLESAEPELLWITGFEAIMVAPDGETQLSQEFMCHSNLDIDMPAHREIFNWTKNAANRLFTLSQGQYELFLPEGFGIPVLSTEALSLTTQVLNHNYSDINLEVRHKITIHFERDRNVEIPMQALFMKSANGLVITEDSSGYYNVDPDAASEHVHGEQAIHGIRAGGSIRTDSYGQKFAGFWVVPPGRQETRTLVTNWMNLPFDTDVHYIASHVHPFAEYMELRDLSEDASVFRSNVVNSAGKIGVDHVEYYSSTKGYPLYADHEYQLVTMYNNTLDRDQDSMAVMYMYVRDNEFSNPLKD